MSRDEHHIAPHSRRPVLLRGGGREAHAVIERRSDIGLDVIIDSIRGRAASAGAPTALSWRMRVLRQLCRSVQFAHARRLAHPGLTARDIRISAGGQVIVLGWRPARDWRDAEADVNALGAIALELLTASPDRAPVPELPRAEVKTWRRFVDVDRLLASAGLLAAGLLFGWIGLLAGGALTLMIWRRFARGNRVDGS